jgi:hypothetical protein
MEWFASDSVFAAMNVEFERLEASKAHAINLHCHERAEPSGYVESVPEQLRHGSFPSMPTVPIEMTASVKPLRRIGLFHSTPNSSIGTEGSGASQARVQLVGPTPY